MAPKRKAAEGPVDVTWEWGGGPWKKYNDADAELLEKLWSESGGKGKVETNDLSFAKKTPYELDFSGGTQTNTATKTARKFRRVAADGGPPAKKPALMKKGSSGDLAYAEGLGEADAPKKDAAPKSSVWKGDSTIPDPPPLDVAAIKEQAALGAQSKRNMKKIDYGKAVDKDKHAKHCFDKMLENEQRNCGEWAVFYHSYSHAALIYEVQAAIAAVLFRFKGTYASLPRLMRGCFSEIPDAPAMMKEFPKWKDKDHNPRFKAVGICATCSLLAGDSEAPPTQIFLGGYSVGALSITIIEGMFTDCGISAKEAKSLAKSILKLAETAGLHVEAFGAKASSSGHAGHLLQIFMKRHLVDKYCYAAKPYGVPDKPRHPLGEYLNTSGKPHIQGQARIVVHPSAFLQASKVRMFVYSADEKFHNHRVKFQEDVADLLSPILGSKEARTRAAQNIFGGSLPAWFKPEDQREAAKSSLKKLGTKEWK